MKNAFLWYGELMTKKNKKLQGKQSTLHENITRAGYKNEKLQFKMVELSAVVFPYVLVKRNS